MTRNIKGRFLLFKLRWVSGRILKDEKKKIPKSQGNSDQAFRTNLSAAGGTYRRGHTHSIAE